jgi:predicted nucleic acid-binding protein
MRFGEIMRTTLAIDDDVLVAAKAIAQHQDRSLGEVSLVANDDVDTAKLLTSARITDTYLLALAKAHGGQLASFDRKLSVAAVRDGKAAFHLIPSRMRPA